MSKETNTLYEDDEDLRVTTMRAINIGLTAIENFLSDEGYDSAFWTWRIEADILGADLESVLERVKYEGGF